MIGVATVGSPLARRSNVDRDVVMKHVLTAVASLTVVVILLIIVFMAGNAMGLFSHVGIFDFILGTEWKPTSGEFGALPMIAGTILVTLGAMVFACPLGIGAAIYISEIASPKMRNILKPICEVFAGIPSVVYGFFGLVVLVPTLADLFPEQLLFGSSWLAGSILLGMMALPTVISVSEDAINAVPRSYREASLAMGATKWETISKVVVPAAISGISSAVILGVGRAIGETMAVMMVTGNATIIPDPLWNVFSLISTITGTLALEMPEVVVGDIHYSSLFALALVLMIMVLLVNICARMVITSIKRKSGELDSKTSISYRLFGRENLLPDRFQDYIHNKGGWIRTAAMYVLVFVFVWMIVSLFENHLLSIILAAIAVGLVSSVRSLLSAFDSSSIDKASRVGLTAVMGVVILMLVVILGYIIGKGLPVIDWEFITQSPTDGGLSGGIMPAIIGTLELLVGTAIIALPLGILTGTYLAEYAKDTRTTRIIRESIDVLNGTPSIVFGLFGMTFLVISLGWGYSLIAGWFALSFMIMPVIIRTTEEALKAVPNDLREASRALGASKWKTTFSVILPAALGGTITGAILALGRAMGETAPIMFTAVVAFQPHLAGSIMDPVMALPYHLYYLATEVTGSGDIQYGCATILLLIVLSMFLLASVVRNHYNKKVKW